jgi:hypothetical protein
MALAFLPPDDRQEAQLLIKAAGGEDVEAAAVHSPARPDGFVDAIRR